MGEQSDIPLTRKDDIAKVAEAEDEAGVVDQQAAVDKPDEADAGQTPS